MIILIMVIILIVLVIAIVDYVWYGRKLMGKTPLKSGDIIGFYFSRTIGEIIMFVLGVVFMYLLMTQ